MDVRSLTVGAVILISLVGCLHGPPDHALSDDWAHRIRKDEEFAEWKRRVQAEGDEIVFAGKDSPVRAAVYVDEKGRPRLNVLRNKGLSADLNVKHGEPDVKVKYKVEW